MLCYVGHHNTVVNAGLKKRHEAVTLQVGHSNIAVFGASQRNSFRVNVDTIDHTFVVFAQKAAHHSGAAAHVKHQCAVRHLGHNFGQRLFLIGDHMACVVLVLRLHGYACSLRQ